jgi:hypothetical protein
MHNDLLKNAMQLNPKSATAHEILSELEHAKLFWATHNIILNLSKATLNADDFKTFSKIQKEHRKRKKSFVLLAPQADFNEIDETLAVVPTQQEALDIIEMEEIERDLGL